MRDTSFCKCCQSEFHVRLGFFLKEKQKLRECNFYKQLTPDFHLYLYMLSRCHLAPPQSSFVAPRSDEHLDASHPTDFPPRVPHPFPVSAPSFSHAHPWPQFPPHHSPSGQASAVSLQPPGGATQRSLLPEAAAAPASAWSRSTRENVVASPAVRSMML